MAKAAADRFVVIYRNGGWANATWHRTLEVFGDRDEATVWATDKLGRQGYRFMVKSSRELEAIGLPVGFCQHADATTGKMVTKTCKCL